MYRITKVILKRNGELPFCPIFFKIEYVVLFGAPNNVSMGMKLIRRRPWHLGSSNIAYGGTTLCNVTFVTLYMIRIICIYYLSVALFTCITVKVQHYLLYPDTKLL